jgi:hypothetical protein
MVMVSDGAGYRPLSTYLHVSLSEFLMKLRKLDRELTIESRTLPASGLSRKRFNVKVSLRTMAVLRDSLNLKAIFGESPWRGVLKALWDLGSGRTLDETLRTRTAFRHVLTVMTIPYEDKGGLEDARLKDCPAVFAYEDVETGEIRTTAFCSWQMVKDAVCKNIQEHYHGKEEPAAMAEIG